VCKSWGAHTESRVHPLALTFFSYIFLPLAQEEKEEEEGGLARADSVLMTLDLESFYYNNSKND